MGTGQEESGDDRFSKGASQSMGKRPTMSDIAAVLGISKNSVSLALSGNRGVSQATRLNVLRVANELGYTRARPGSRLSVPHRMVAVVFQERILHPPATLFFSPVLQHIQQELSKRHCALSLFGVNPDDETAVRIPPMLNGTVEGCIVLSRLRPAFLEALMTVAPMVLVDHYDSTFPCDKVLTENEVGAFLAVRHLVEMEHRSIGFIGEVGRTPSYRERWNGYRTAMNRFGLPISVAWEQTTVSEVESMQSLTTLRDGPSAWFCANDIYASNVIQYCHDAGLRVPQDVAVVGFDDLPLTLTTSPPITSVHVDAEYYARQVVDRLMRRIDRPDAPFLSVRIAPRLVLRESTEVAARMSISGGGDRRRDGS